jgi:hypothetical protein
MLPDTGAYAIDAKTKVGVVTSDFAGDLHRRPYLFGGAVRQPFRIAPGLSAHGVWRHHDQERF